MKEYLKAVEPQEYSNLDVRMSAHKNPFLGQTRASKFPFEWRIDNDENDEANMELRIWASHRGPPRPSSLVRFLSVSQYLLELASCAWVLECGVLTSREA